MLKFWKKSELSKIWIAKSCIENSKNCNYFHTGWKLERIVPNNTKNQGFKVSKSISYLSSFFSTYTSAWPCRFAAGKKQSSRCLGVLSCSLYPNDSCSLHKFVNGDILDVVIATSKVCVMGYETVLNLSHPPSTAPMNFLTLQLWRHR